MVSIRGATRRRRGDATTTRRRVTLRWIYSAMSGACTVQYCIIEIVIITHRTVIHARIVRDETLDSDSASDDRRLSSLTTRPFVLDRGRARCQRSPPRASSSPTLVPRRARSRARARDVFVSAFDRFPAKIIDTMTTRVSRRAPRRRTRRESALEAIARASIDRASASENCTSSPDRCSRGRRRRSCPERRARAPTGNASSL